MKGLTEKKMCKGTRVLQKKLKYHYNIGGRICHSLKTIGLNKTCPLVLESKIAFYFLLKELYVLPLEIIFPFHKTKCLPPIGSFKLSLWASRLSY